MARPRSSATPRQAIRAPGLKLLVWALLCALPALGAGMHWRGTSLMLFAIAYPLMSLLAVLLYRHDKRQAGQGGQRIAENTLHGVELLGGWPGALLAQQLYRHKTRKLSFQLVFWLIVLVHQVFWIDWLLLGRRLTSFLPL